jgi:hypothetical protein
MTEIEDKKVPTVRKNEQVKKTKRQKDKKTKRQKDR